MNHPLSGSTVIATGSGIGYVTANLAVKLLPESGREHAPSPEFTR